MSDKSSSKYKTSNWIKILSSEIFSFDAGVFSDCEVVPSTADDIDLITSALSNIWLQLFLQHFWSPLL